MKILITSTLNQTQPLETYTDNNGSGLVLWHQDTLSNELFSQIVALHGKPDTLISSAHPEYNVSGFDYYYLPDDLTHFAYQVNKFSTVQDLPTEYCFNFMINKNQTNRFLLIKLVEWFKLTSYDYTWAGADSFSCSDIVEELSLLSADLKYHITKQNFDIPAKFVNLPSGTAQSNLAVWNYAIGEIFSKSAVSLITESIGAEKIINFTEKSLFSVQALTFPIWIGGFRQADHWKNHGFDTFDDVVNHDYQYCDTLVERCIRAFQDNLKLLTDLEYASNVRKQHIDRLLHNRANLRVNLEDLFVEKWNQMPAQLTKTLINMIKTWPLYARNTSCFKLLNFD